MSIEQIKNRLSQDVTILSLEQKEKMRLLINEIKSYIGWESILFILVNLFIWFNMIYFVGLYVAFYVAAIDEKINHINIEGPTAFGAGLWTFVILIPVFILAKYLMLPITLWIVNKFGKNNKVKNIIKNYILKKKILFYTLALDLLYIVFVAIYCNFNSSDYWGIVKSFVFLDLLSGGLTGSYIAVLIYIKVTKKSFLFIDDLSH